MEQIIYFEATVIFNQKLSNLSASTHSTTNQLSAEFRPDEIVKSGWDFHAVTGTVTTSPNEDIVDSAIEVDYHSSHAIVRAFL